MDHLIGGITCFVDAAKFEWGRVNVSLPGHRITPVTGGKSPSSLMAVNGNGRGQGGLSSDTSAQCTLMTTFADNNWVPLPARPHFSSLSLPAVEEGRTVASLRFGPSLLSPESLRSLCKRGGLLGTRDFIMDN